MKSDEAKNHPLSDLSPPSTTDSKHFEASYEVILASHVHTVICSE